MKLALVTTPPSLPSGIGDYVRHLLPHLRERCDVRVYVEGVRAGEELCGERTLALESLRPREHDQVLWQVGNCREHAFMLRPLRAIGGVVALHDWVLFDLAVAAHPALARGSWKGHVLAAREGGASQALIYASTWRQRRAQRSLAFVPPVEHELASLEGPLLAGWHGKEAAGRWTADAALVRVPVDARRVSVELAGLQGTAARLTCAGTVLARGTGMLEAELAEDGTSAGRGGTRIAERAPRVLAIEIEQLALLSERRARGDSRRLGAFVRRLAFDRGAGWEELDLAAPSALPLVLAHPDARRFELPLNRSVVRFGDAFIVHSRHMGERILADRNAPTPMALVHHGAQPRWRDEDRRVERAALLEGLGPDRPPRAAGWIEAFLLSSFGALQRHKRIDVLLEALASARRKGLDARLVLVGAAVEGEIDARALVRKLGLQDEVVLTGHLPEAEAWRWIHAADLGVQLRGPSTGGTSGGVFATLSMGRGVIASDVDEQRELPESCVLRVAQGAGEAERLAELLIGLWGDPRRRAALETAARSFVEKECSWALVARSYGTALEALPAPRGARKSLLALRMQQARRGG